eukprot:jgi/Bigna1/79047/fgenesh1_pg.59_\
MEPAHRLKKQEIPDCGKSEKNFDDADCTSKVSRQRDLLLGLGDLLLRSLTNKRDVELAACKIGQTSVEQVTIGNILAKNRLIFPTLRKAISHWHAWRTTCSTYLCVPNLNTPPLTGDMSSGDGENDEELDAMLDGSNLRPPSHPFLFELKAMHLANLFIPAIISNPCVSFALLFGNINPRMFRFGSRSGSHTEIMVDALAEFDDDEPLPAASSPSSPSPSEPTNTESDSKKGVQGDALGDGKKNVKKAPENEGLLKDLLDLLQKDGSKESSGDSSAEDDFVQSLQQVLERMKDEKGSVDNEEFTKAMKEDSESLKKMREIMQASTSEKGGASESENVEDILKSLSNELKNMPAQSKDDDALKMLLGELDKLEIPEGGEANADMDSFVDQMIGKMMSKEYLYPAFPEFLKKSEGKSSEAEMKQYKQQYKCFEELCEVFEKEGDTAEANKKIIDLMQKMQSYGPPPQEIMSGLLPGVQFDNEGMPSLPGMGGGAGGAGEECAIM